MSEFATFVGRAYYSPEAFVREALEMRASRRVSYRLIGSMNWGDQIYCLQGDQMKKKRRNAVDNSLVLGFFRIERLGGIPSSLTAGLVKTFGGEEMGDPTETVIRGCGEYLVAGTYGVKATLPEIVRWLRDNTDLSDVSFLLQGRFTSLLKPPQIFLRNIHQRFGFRRFDGVAFRADVQEALDAGEDPLVLSGTFIPDEVSPAKTPKTTAVQFVDSYRMYPLWTGPSWRPEPITTESSLVG